MAKNSIDTYGAAGKTNLLMFDPDALTLVEDAAHPLYDERVHLPLDEAMVLNIDAFGVVQPIVVTKDTETGQTLVVAGRQRVKHAREANRRRRETGRPPLQVPAVVRRGEGLSLAAAMVVENEIRKDDTPLGRAGKMVRLMEHGATQADLALMFGCSAQTVHNMLVLYDCTAAVRRAVDAGEITVGHALKLAKLPPQEQRAKVAELKAAGEGASGHAKARKQRAVVEGEAKPRMRSRSAVQARHDASEDDAERALLAWVLGLDSEPQGGGSRREVAAAAVC